eukprot:1161921-Pelagomonas_calceolata.AAC.11
MDAVLSELFTAPPWRGPYLSTAQELPPLAPLNLRLASEPAFHHPALRLVLCIRGSLELGDICTDLAAQPAAWCLGSLGACTVHQVGNSFVNCESTHEMMSDLAARCLGSLGACTVQQVVTWGRELARQEHVDRATGVHALCNLKSRNWQVHDAAMVLGAVRAIMLAMVLGAVRSHGAWRSAQPWCLVQCAAIMLGTPYFQQEQRVGRNQGDGIMLGTCHNAWRSLFPTRAEVWQESRGQHDCFPVYHAIGVNAFCAVA